MQVFQSHEGVVPVADFFGGGGGGGERGWRTLSLLRDSSPYRPKGPLCTILRYPFLDDWP